MKKQNKAKLQLNKLTVRTFTVRSHHQLNQVVGGNELAGSINTQFTRIDVCCGVQNPQDPQK